MNYINDPATRQDAIHLMAKRASINPVAYERIMKGTKLLNLAENKRIFQKGSGFDSIYGASYYVNQFNLRQGLYAQSPVVDQLINPNLIEELP
ncbi:NitT/TauT family transport system substrate-binding protein [Acinetobacter genomosp. 15BJ]|uniref:NitT/TauT family transport system substrate-binding protein n=1 Tax=Acinetobacter genomosp. 15BJ TaxID=106651 RepID=R9B0F0_9GAMM|nr:NitT/TauT family transport system substrate-binding protein [Acinetobacter genomosp. 15BJ]